MIIARLYNTLVPNLLRNLTPLNSLTYLAIPPPNFFLIIKYYLKTNKSYIWFSQFSELIRTF
jgi:hypothetical protein